MVDQNTGGAGGPQETPRAQNQARDDNRRNDEHRVDERRTTEVRGMSTGSAIFASVLVLAGVGLIAFLVMQPWNWNSGGRDPWNQRNAAGFQQKQPRVQRHSEFSEGQDYCDKYVGRGVRFITWVGVGRDRRAICG